MHFLWMSFCKHITHFEKSTLVTLNTLSFLMWNTNILQPGRTIGVWFITCKHVYQYLN